MSRLREIARALVPEGKSILCRTRLNGAAVLGRYEVVMKRDRSAAA